MNNHRAEMSIDGGTWILLVALFVCLACDRFVAPLTMARHKKQFKHYPAMRVDHVPPALKWLYEHEAELKMVPQMTPLSGRMDKRQCRLCDAIGRACLFTDDAAFQACGQEARGEVCCLE